MKLTIFLRELLIYGMVIYGTWNLVQLGLAKLIRNI